MMGCLTITRLVPAALGLSAGATVKSTACESARIPPRFCSAARSFSSHDGDMDLGNKRDCSVYKKYSQDSCGGTFENG